MIELFERKETSYIEKANGNLVFGNKTPITEKGTMELVIGTDRFLIPIDENGFWRWEATTPYADGNYSLSLRQIDMAGNISLPSLATIVIDSTAPEAPLLLNLYDDYGAEQRSFDPGSTTDDKRPTLTGVAQKGATVYLLNDKNEKIGSAVADKTTGVWKMEPTQDLEDGTNALRLVAEETFADVTRAGAPSAAFNIIIGSDGLPPNTITITEAFDDVGSATGPLANGALTDDTTPTLSGTASSGSTVIVYYRLAGSNTWAGSATATVTDESWSWTPGSALPVGSYEFQASIGANSSALFSLEIATAEQIGLRTRIESAYDDFGQDQGPLANGAITDDGTPTLRGHAEANGNVIIRYMLEGGSAASVVVNADSAGNWRWTPAAELATGVWSFDVQAQGRSSWSNAFKLEITGSGENSYAPTISYAFDDFGTSTGERKSGASTDDTTPTLHGKAVANSVVYLQAINGAEVETFSVIADASSNWQWTPAAELALGGWKFKVSNSSENNWGSDFDLKISSSGRSGSVDFDYYFTDLESFLNNGFYYPEDSLRIICTSYPGLNFVDTSSLGIPELGDRALKMKKNDSIVFSGLDEKKLASHITDFSIQIYNPSTEEFTIEIYIDTIINRPIRPIDITLKPGLNTLTQNDIGADILEEAPAYNIWIWNRGKQTNEDIIIDNFTWTNYSDKNNSYSLEHEDDNTHQVASIDDSTASNLVGKEWQVDTLLLTENGQLLDLSTNPQKIKSIEIFDITGTGDNTLKLDLTALLQHGEKDLFIEDGKTQLLVKGNEGDVVQLKDILPEGSDISEWQHQDGTVTVAGVEYNVYSHGDDAELLVQQGVKTELV
ncbi:Ig-like domain-containing protein [Pantoea sp. SOD02]|uniref:Ig-like domain-containing protein n=1 Tax=Pantoea sp. SOD02 TaxID=2970818 RepID=UPI0021574C12|nr:Ig-like domain-containing protein [Pantoea sp. SOD02]UVC27969.1 Ig-like domain-containing protein [Pantoea sp. SOD02]